jgi:hypothetical protein
MAGIKMIEAITSRRPFIEISSLRGLPVSDIASY